MLYKEYTLSTSDANALKTALGLDPFYDDVKITDSDILMFLNNGVDIEAQATITLGDTIANLYTPTNQVDDEARTQLVSYSGRFYMYSDSRWVTESDDNYGSGYYQFAENAGYGTEPIYEWEHMGTMVPAGKVIKNLRFACRCNSSNVTDLEMRVVCKMPNPSSRWQTGVDNDSEVTITELYSGDFVDGTMSGNMQDMRMRKFDLNNFEAAEDCYLSIYIKPVRTGGGTKYLYSNWTWEII